MATVQARPPIVFVQRLVGRRQTVIRKELARAHRVSSSGDHVGRQVLGGPDCTLGHPGGQHGIRAATQQRGRCPRRGFSNPGSWPRGKNCGHADGCAWVDADPSPRRRASAARGARTTGCCINRISTFRRDTLVRLLCSPVIRGSRLRLPRPNHRTRKMQGNGARELHDAAGNGRDGRERPADQLSRVSLWIHGAQILLPGMLHGPVHGPDNGGLEIGSSLPQADRPARGQARPRACRRPT